MEADFIFTKLALEELRKMGYTEVWLGNVSNPHWKHGMSNGIVAAPRLRDRTGWPRLWSASEENFGQKSAGNGLTAADNMFRSKIRDMIPGHYVLIGEEWNPS